MSYLGDALPLDKNFWKWFGKSKVRREDGTPRVVYHGTRSPMDYYAFETGAIFDDEGNLLLSSSGDPGAYIGPHFTGSHELASKFAGGKGASWDSIRFVTNEFEGEEAAQPAYGRVIPVYLRILKPIYFDSDDELISFIWANGQSNVIEDQLELEAEDYESNLWIPPSEMERLFNSLSDTNDYGEGSSLREEAASELGHSVRDKLIQKGYDGIIYQNTIEGGGLSYCVFDSAQVKSAIANRGTWSLDDPNILH